MLQRSEIFNDMAYRLNVMLHVMHASGFLVSFCWWGWLASGYVFYLLDPVGGWFAIIGSLLAFSACCLLTTFLSDLIWLVVARRFFMDGYALWRAEGFPVEPVLMRFNFRVLKLL